MCRIHVRRRWCQIHVRCIADAWQIGVRYVSRWAVADVQKHVRGVPFLQLFLVVSVKQCSKAPHMCVRYWGQLQIRVRCVQRSDTYLILEILNIGAICADMGGR